MKTLQALFIGLTAYIIMYGLSIALALLLIPEPPLRTFVAFLLTLAILARCLHITYGYAPQLETWGKEHVK